MPGFLDLCMSKPWILALALLPLGVVAVLWIRLARRNIPFPAYPWLGVTGARPDTGRRFGLALRCCALLLLVLLAAGLRESRSGREEEVPAALVIVLDLSSSMTARDFGRDTRLAVVKENLRRAVIEHPGPDTGLVVFAGAPELLVPVTPDHNAVLRHLAAARSAGYEEDGTAIGSALAAATNRLRAGPWSDRRILLVTDGVSNRGALAPLDAARLAASLGIRIDAVGIGTDQPSHYMAPSREGPPVEVVGRIEIDEPVLIEVSRTAGGSYHRASDAVALRAALTSAMQDSSRSGTRETRVLWKNWRLAIAAAVLLLLALELALTHLWLSEVPA